jgi:hypothetical protein
MTAPPRGQITLHEERPGVRSPIRGPGTFPAQPHAGTMPGTSDPRETSCAAHPACGQDPRPAPVVDS